MRTLFRNTTQLQQFIKLFYNEVVNSHKFLTDAKNDLIHQNISQSPPLINILERTSTSFIAIIRPMAVYQ